MGTREEKGAWVGVRRKKGDVGILARLTFSPPALWLLEAVVQVQLSSGCNGPEQSCDFCMAAVSLQQPP